MKHSVREIKLKNGSQGLLINVPDATVMSFEFSFRAGDFLCLPDKWETAHLMEHLALGANQEYRSQRKFNAIFEQNGAFSNAYTSRHDVSYVAECADIEWNRIFDLLILAISKPLFLQKEFDAEYGNVSEELVQRSNDHATTLSLTMDKAYGLRALPYQERQRILKNVKIDDVRKHYKKTHYAQNMRFVIAGKFDHERVEHIKHKIERIELITSNNIRIELPDETPHKLTRPLNITNRTVPNIHFYFDTYKIGGRLPDPELDALILVNNVLTGTLHSRILGKAREKGLVYHVNSNWSWARNYTSWWMGAQVSRQNAPKLFNIMTTEIRRILNGKLSLSELQTAKDFALGSYQRTGQTVGSVASEYSGLYFGNGRIADYQNYPDAIKSVTRQRAVSAFQKMFEDQIWGLGFLGTSNQQERKQLFKQISSIWQ